MLKDAALVFVGGGAGSVLRYLVWVAFSRAGAHSFPWATLTVNLAGCLAIGLLAGLAAPRDSLPPAAPFAGIAPSMRLLLITGLLGGFTTFSAFGLETIHLIRQGRAGGAATYVVASVLLGVALAWMGWTLARPSGPLPA